MNIKKNYKKYNYINYKEYNHINYRQYKYINYKQYDQYKYINYKQPLPNTLKTGTTLNSEAKRQYFI